MNTILINQLEAVAAELETILFRRTRVGGDYAREFGKYSADYARSLLESPDPDGLKRYRAQLRTVVETIDEIADQTVDEVLDTLEDGLRILLAVGRAAL